ncbi:MAG: hypothetical protein EXR01_09350 [Acetobacteraceae bacterium]|nr:hypothetical protein [Acetobacteraceae bacterium]
MLRQRIAGRHDRRDEILRLVAHNKRRREIPADLLSPHNLDAFRSALSARLRDRSSRLRRDYARLLIGKVVVGEREIEVQGSNLALLSAAADADAIVVGRVPSSVREWRTKLANKKLEN